MGVACRRFVENSVRVRVGMTPFAAHLLRNGVRLSERSWSGCDPSPTCGEQGVGVGMKWFAAELLVN